MQVSPLSCHLLHLKSKYSPQYPVLLPSMSSSIKVLEKLMITQPRNSPPFMEHKGSSPCLQEPTTGPYPELDEPVHNFTPYFPKIHSNILLSTPWRKVKHITNTRMMTHEICDTVSTLGLDCELILLQIWRCRKETGGCVVELPLMNTITRQIEVTSTEHCKNSGKKDELKFEFAILCFLAVLHNSAKDP